MRPSRVPPGEACRSSLEALVEAEGAVEHHRPHEGPRSQPRCGRPLGHRRRRGRQRPIAVDAHRVPEREQAGQHRRVGRERDRRRRACLREGTTLRGERVEPGREAGPASVEPERVRRAWFERDRAARSAAPPPSARRSRPASARAPRRSSPARRSRAPAASRAAGGRGDPRRLRSERERAWRGSRGHQGGRAPSRSCGSASSLPRG